MILQQQQNAIVPMRVGDTVYLKVKTSPKQAICNGWRGRVESKSGLTCKVRLVQARCTNGPAERLVSLPSTPSQSQYSSETPGVLKFHLNGVVDSILYHVAETPTAISKGIHNTEKIVDNASNLFERDTPFRRPFYHAISFGVGAAVNKCIEYSKAEVRLSSF